MMEQAYTCKRHGDAILVAGVDNIVVAYAASSLCDILYAALVGTLDVVAEWEEGIATQCHTLVLGEPLTTLFCGERLWLLGEEHLPSTVAQHVFPLVRDIHVDGVVAVGATYAWLEGKRHHLRALPHPPCVGLAASQTGAVDTALLSGADTDGLTILDVAYRVALGIFQGDEGDDQVTASLPAPD